MCDVEGKAERKGCSWPADGTFWSSRSAWHAHLNRHRLPTLLPRSAGDNPSITAFVDGLQVVQNCGCYAGVPSAPANGSGAAPAGLGRSATGLISG